MLKNERNIVDVNISIIDLQCFNQTKNITSTNTWKSSATKC